MPTRTLVRVYLLEKQTCRVKRGDDKEEFVPNTGDLNVILKWFGD